MCLDAFLALTLLILGVLLVDDKKASLASYNLAVGRAFLD